MGLSHERKAGLARRSTCPTPLKLTGTPDRTDKLVELFDSGLLPAGAPAATVGCAKAVDIEGAEKVSLQVAFRTPPVRGKDRVHLIEKLTPGSYESPLARYQRTLGKTTKEVRHGNASSSCPPES